VSLHYLLHKQEKGVTLYVVKQPALVIVIVGMSLQLYDTNHMHLGRSVQLYDKKPQDQQAACSAGSNNTLPPGSNLQGVYTTLRNFVTITAD